MSSQKKPTFWQRFKDLLTTKETSTESSSSDIPNPTSAKSKAKASSDFNHLSDKPITDSILSYLDANEFNYYYHPPSKESDADAPIDSTANNSSKNVQHITMSMRYYSEDGDGSVEHQTSPHNARSQSDSMDTAGHKDIEWGCVIRVHEHTQLVAFYGILPFNLPESHLQAGIVLATQINYDMMLGCIEIDIRDGEIRFKNSLDLEPVIQVNGGQVPPKVIDYLLKGVMAMTASFAPLFSDLVTKDPQQFELKALLEDIRQAQAEHTFYLASTTLQ